MISRKTNQLLSLEKKRQKKMGSRIKKDKNKINKTSKDVYLDTEEKVQLVT